jgi:hypothetical protein
VDALLTIWMTVVNRTSVGVKLLGFWYGCLKSGGTQWQVKLALFCLNANPPAGWRLEKHHPTSVVAQTCHSYTGISRSLEIKSSIVPSFVIKRSKPS